MKPTVLIVGAGVIGCSLAYQLTLRGAAVTVIDAAELSSGTSSATFAWVNANDKAPAEYQRLNVLGLRAHERARTARALGAADWFHQTGNLHVAATDAEMDALEEKVGRLTSTGYDATVLTRAEIEELEPSIDSAGLKGGALYPKEGWIDTIAMCAGLLQKACASGAVFLPYQRVTELRPTGQVTVTSADGTTRHYAADVTVLAAGNGNRPILRTMDVDFPTRPSTGDEGTGVGPSAVGLIATTGPVETGIGHVVHAPGISLRPARNGGVTFTDSPTGALWKPDDPRIWTVPGLLLDRARMLYPALRNATTETVTLGTRVLPNDGVTISGWITEKSSVYAIATHSGVTLAAHLAEVVSEEVITGERHESLRPFGLTRFAS
ncbi:NAD(P)/FAD-dependent oxidoreductase [Streptomyces sp. NPDC004629]|uniref:NAD(P)/FAD-dependent oxidoreductase n=1 Tax=Streptomyces sp. NPDC004629 TaxID=3364705 RepID=UPI0036D0039D